MLRRYERLDLIFGALKQGKNTDEIDRVLAEAEKAERDRKCNLGFKSEARVRGILCRLPCVRAVHFVQHYSEADAQGKDLIVYLNERDVDVSDRLGVVLIQVKSSQQGIEYYRESRRRELNLSHGGLLDKLIEDKLMLINGQEEEETIETSFYDQLQKMQDFHSPRPFIRRK